MLSSSDDYVGAPDGGLPRAQNLKLRIFNKFNLKRPYEPLMDRTDNERMIRRKLISEDQVLINESEDEDRNEVLSEEDAVPVLPFRPSYISSAAMVSWSSSHGESPIFIHFPFSRSLSPFLCRNKFKQFGRTDFGVCSARTKE